MINEARDTNTVTVIGKVVSDIEFSHEMFGEGFYNFYLKVPRLSEYTDILPITISERLIINLNIEPETYVVVHGQFRSYNRNVNNLNKLVLTIFARDIYIPDEEEINELLRKPNEIFLDGYICKPPVYRTTPFGREITDLLIAVNRQYNKSDYIPCIAWGRNARFCENLLVGDHIRLWGRIQSRDYQKRLSTGETFTRTAYEISISKLEYIKDDNNREDKIKDEE